LLPLVTVFTTGLGGFIITCVIVLFLGNIILISGIGDALILSSLSGLASFLPFQFFVTLLTGFGFAGFSMNSIKLTLLIIFGDAESDIKTKTSSLIFFGFSTVILFICALIVVILYKNEHFLEQIKHSGEIQIKVDELAIPINEEETVVEKEETKLMKLKRVIALTNVHIFVGFMNWMISLSIFPGVIFSPRFLYE
jgi:hypothetical protein